jgi:ACS family glucarate transporter-like MFS transporter
MVHYGWRWSFWMSAAVGLFAGVIWYVVARDVPEDHPRVSTAELAHIQAGRATKDRIAADRIGWSAILASKEVWCVTLAYFSFGYVAYIFFTWFFIYLAKVRGLNLKTSALYTTLPFLAMAACSPLGGAISDALTRRFGKRFGRCSISVVGLLLTAVFLVFGSRAHDARLASIVLAGGAGALYLSQSSFWAVTADIARGSSGAVSGFMNTGNQLGGMLTAQLTPIIALKWGWTAPFFVAAVLAAFGAVAWLLVDPRRMLAPSMPPLVKNEIVSS